MVLISANFRNKYNKQPLSFGVWNSFAYSFQPTQPGYSQGPPPPGVGGVNQTGMQPTYRPGPQSMGNSTMPPAPGMAQNHIPNNTPNQNANLSSSFGRMSLQVGVF